MDTLLRFPCLIVFAGLVGNVRLSRPVPDGFGWFGGKRPLRESESYGWGQISSSGNWPVTT
jgi:hypothetical protein